MKVMNKNFEMTKEQEQWSRRARRKYGKDQRFWENLIREQDGKCNLTKVPLLFDVRLGTPKKGGLGCHPLYAAVDHVEPGSDDRFQILCYDINDLKGHIPKPLFGALKNTKAWKRFVKDWQKLAKEVADDKKFKQLIKKGYLESSMS